MNQTKNLTHQLCNNFVTFYGNARRLQNNTGIKVRGSKEMSQKKETENQTTNGNGTKPNSPKTEDKEPKAYKSVMKAFEMTHKRLFPKLYKTRKTNG